MSDYIEFSINNKFLTRQQGDDIKQLVDNITTYEYDEIFTGAISIIKNGRSTIFAKNVVPSKQGPFLNNPGFCKSSFTVENDDLIYKAFSIDHVLSKHNQDDIIMFC